jgi:DNA-binding Lrp family transcriptional regulator
MTVWYSTYFRAKRWGVSLLREQKLMQVLEEFGAALARIPEVVEAHLVTGDYDYLVKVAVAGTEQISARESL